jgi:Fe-S cluster assembly iron-binding protein IscA
VGSCILIVFFSHKEEVAMSIVSLDPSACLAIKTALSEKDLPFSVRIEIRSTGCCDASLGIAASMIEINDLSDQIDGLQIVMSPTVHELVGGVSISYRNDAEQTGFIIVSEKSLNEWAGFAAGCIRL